MHSQSTRPVSEKKIFRKKKRKLVTAGIPNASNAKKTQETLLPNVKYAFAQDGKIVPKEVEQVLNNQALPSPGKFSWITFYTQSPNGELDSRMPVDVHCLLSSTEKPEEYHYYAGRLQKSELKQQLVRPWVDYETQYKTYVDRKPKTLMERIQTQITDQITGSLNDRSRWQFVLPKLVRPLPFKQARTFLHACLPLITCSYFHPGMEVWSHWPKARSLWTSIMFQQWVANQQSVEMSQSVLPPQRWDPTPFFSFHGTDKTSALLILNHGPNIHMAHDHQAHGSGFYVSKDIHRARRYVKSEGNGEGAIVMLLTCNGLYHSQMPDWNSEYISKSRTGSEDSDDSDDDEPLCDSKLNISKGNEDSDDDERLCNNKPLCPPDTDDSDDDEPVLNQFNGSQFTRERRKEVKLTSQTYEVGNPNYLVVRNNCVVFPLCAFVY
jgi:hypothetical protein